MPRLSNCPPIRTSCSFPRSSRSLRNWRISACSPSPCVGLVRLTSSATPLCLRYERGGGIGKRVKSNEHQGGENKKTTHFFAGDATRQLGGKPDNTTALAQASVSPVTGDGTSTGAKRLKKESKTTKKQLRVGTTHLQIKARIQKQQQKKKDSPPLPPFLSPWGFLLAS